MQKCFPKIPNIFSAGPNPRKNIYCPTAEYILMYFGLGSDILGESNITPVPLKLWHQQNLKFIIKKVHQNNT